MDTVTPMGRRFVAPPTSMGGGGDYHDYYNHPPPPPPPMQHHQPGHFWYPPPPSSAHAGEPQFPPPHHLQQPHLQQQHLPPPMPSGAFPPLPPPHYPQQQQQPPPPWVPLPDPLQQQYPPPPSNFPPAVPPLMGMHPGAPSGAAAGSPHHHGVPPLNPPYPATRPMYPLPAHPHASRAPSPPPPPPATMPHAYPQSSQTWGNPSWHATQGWDYADTKFHFSHEEDWAARARAWAAANSATESLPMQPNYMPSGTPNNVQHSSGPPLADSQHSTLSTQDQQFPDSSTDQHGRVNNLQESSLNSLSYSVTTFPTYDARNEGLARDTGITASLPQQTFSSSTSVNVQEVPSSYSSFPGSKETVDQFEKMNMPLHFSSPVMLAPGILSTLAVSPVSREQSHLPYRDQSVEYPDTGGRSQTIEQIPFDHGQIQNTGSANVDQGRPIDQSLPSSSIHGWAQSVAPGPVFSHVTSVPPGSQFDSSSISSSLPGHPAQVFGHIQGHSFQPGISSVASPFGFDAGSSLHPAAAFPVDANEAFNLSERPKKAAVPNWLRDEIIKKKATIASSTQEHPNGGPSHSTVAEVHEKVFRNDEAADRKSIDSTRSTEEEDEEEDDVDAARTAAINQEIKRVLTDVLLKVTDELFEEIATKVLNEDELEVDHNAAVAKRDSLSPPQAVNPKTSAKVPVPVTPVAGKSSAVGHSLLGSSREDVLGLANYASDEDSDETQVSRIPFSGKAHDSSDQHETRVVTLENTLAQQTAAEEPSHGPLGVESDNRNSAGCNGVFTHKNGLEVDSEGRAVKSLESGSTLDRKVVDSEGRAVKYLESGSTLDRKVLVRKKQDLESESADGDFNSEKSKIGQITESVRKSGSRDVLHDRRGPFGRDFTEEVESIVPKAKREDSGSENLRKHVDRDQKLEKTDERAISKRRSKDQATDVREPGSRRAVYHDNDMDDKKGLGRDRKDRMKEDDHWKRERIRDEKEDKLREVTRDSQRKKSRRTSSPSARGRNGRDSPLGSPSDGSGEETSETSKRRKLQSSRHSLSPSPTRSRRQVLRSPHSKHNQRRHSPYSHSDTRRRRRSRSSSPAHRKRSGHDR